MDFKNEPLDNPCQWHIIKKSPNVRNSFFFFFFLGIEYASPFISRFYTKTMFVILPFTEALVQQ